MVRRFHIMPFIKLFSQTAFHRRGLATHHCAFVDIYHTTQLILNALSRKSTRGGDFRCVERCGRSMQGSGGGSERMRAHKLERMEEPTQSKVALHRENRLNTYLLWLGRAGSGSGGELV